MRYHARRNDNNGGFAHSPTRLVKEMIFNYRKAERVAMAADPYLSTYFKRQIVVARDKETHAIGNNGKLLWDLPKERKTWLHSVIKGTVLVVGRKTFEGLPEKFLTEHEVIVMTGTEQGYFKRLPLADAICSDLDDFEKVCDEDWPEERFSIIGGSEIYQLFLPLVDRLHISEVVNPDSWCEDADSFFHFDLQNIPEINYGSPLGVLYTSGGSLEENGMIVEHGRWDLLRKKAGIL